MYLFRIVLPKTFRIKKCPLCLFYLSKFVFIELCIFEILSVIAKEREAKCKYLFSLGHLIHIQMLNNPFMQFSLTKIKNLCIAFRQYNCKIPKACGVKLLLYKNTKCISKRSTMSL